MRVLVCPVLERLSRAPPGPPRPRDRATPAPHSSPRGPRRKNARRRGRSFVSWVSGVWQIIAIRRLIPEVRSSGSNNHCPSLGSTVGRSILDVGSLCSNPTLSTFFYPFFSNSESPGPSFSEVQTSPSVDFFSLAFVVWVLI